MERLTDNPLESLAEALETLAETLETLADQLHDEKRGKLRDLTRISQNVEGGYR